EHSDDTTNTSTEKYETLITGLIKAHNFPEAKRLFDEARSKEHVFDDNMYLNIFKSATRLNYMKDAVALKELCIEKGIELDDYAMSDLIVCYIKNNDVQEAEQVFNDLVEKGRPPLRFACIALARQFESEGKPDKIKDIYEKYNQVGQEKIPFMRFLLGAYITCQNPDAAIETVREELIEKKTPPGAVGTKALFKKLIVNNFELDKEE
ncbi:leucine-rich PPR motif-containing protein, mitochondrial-like, partial [Saccoglossus kowalevskii]|uniref:Pentatricopeptide repeat-containing protein At5g39710-like n=1 Tax=Saccoglossus kowalevskii TaxID=10224 RepID=A0ABM0MJC0_SACKO